MPHKPTAKGDMPAARSVSVEQGSSPAFPFSEEDQDQDRLANASIKDHHHHCEKEEYERARQFIETASTDDTPNSNTIYTPGNGHGRDPAPPNLERGQNDDAPVAVTSPHPHPMAHRPPVSPIMERPADFHVGGTIDLDEENGVQFDELSTLGPYSHYHHHHRDHPFMMNGQIFMQTPQRPSPEEPGWDHPPAPLRPAEKKDPKGNTEEDQNDIIVHQPKTVCGIARLKFILGVLLFAVLLIIGIAFGIIFGLDNGGGDGGDNDSMRVIPPSPEQQNSPPTFVEAPVPAPVSVPVPVPVPTAPVAPPQDVDVGNGLELQQSLVGEHNNDRFGAYLELTGDGSTIAIGASGSEPYVSILRAERGSSDWSVIGRIESGTGDTFGHRPDLDETGTTIVIGAPRNDDGVGADSGKVRVFEYQGGTTWSQKGGDIDGLATNDLFGWDVAMSDDGNTIVCTARTGEVGRGYARVFSFDVTSMDWVELGSPLVGEEQDDQFGRSCGISGDGRRIVIGAVLGAAGRQGRVYVYEYNNNGSWERLGQPLDGENPEDFQGTSVDISGDGSYVAIGSSGSDVGPGINSGVAKIYKLLGCCTWVSHGNFIHGQTAEGFLGSGHISMSRDGQTLAVGALGYSGNQGIAYLYRFLAGDWRLVDESVGDFDGDQYGFSACIAGS